VPVGIVGGKPNPSRILVAMDCSEGASRAARFAGGLLRDNPKASMTLFHATRGFGILPLARDYFSVPEEQTDWIERERETLAIDEEKMSACFGEITRNLAEEGIDRERIRTRIVQARSRSEAIIEAARTEGCETLVVGRRGLSRVEEFIMGRVSSKVLQMAPDSAVWVGP